MIVEDIHPVLSFSSMVKSGNWTRFESVDVAVTASFFCIVPSRVRSSEAITRQPLHAITSSGLHCAASCRGEVLD